LSLEALARRAAALEGCPIAEARETVREAHEVIAWRFEAWPDDEHVLRLARLLIQHHVRQRERAWREGSLFAS
jgi:hypothetical protein